MNAAPRREPLDPLEFLLTTVPAMPVLIARELGRAAWRTLDVATATPRLLLGEAAKSGRVMPAAFLLAWIPVALASCAD